MTPEKIARINELAKKKKNRRFDSRRSSGTSKTS